MRLLGISCFYHESAAALIEDGRIVAASAEERFSRVKHDASFPGHAIDFCLRTAGVSSRELDYVVFYEKPFRKFERNIISSLRYYPWSYRFFVESMRNAFAQKVWIKSIISSHLDIADEKILFVPQHLSHAAASFYPSPFLRAAVLTLDGVGEWTTGTTGEAEGAHIRLRHEMRYPHSVGLLYSTFTAYLGFAVNDGEYKVMGMAGYGKPKYVDRVRKLYTQNHDGSLELHLDYFSFHTSSTRMYSEKFVALFRGLDRFDIAASIQAVTEDIIITMARTLYQETHNRNLVYGGGVALNSVVNAKLLTQTPFRKLFIFPAAGDDGGAVGAALYVYHHVLGYKKRIPLKDVFLGESYRPADIAQLLTSRRIPFRRMGVNVLVRYIVQKLQEGCVVGWFEGRSEFGPRALGHRSILADPKDPHMKDRVNRKIKFREEFRPFAPVVLDSQKRRYFPNADDLVSPFMLATHQASRRARQISAATVHVDGSSRIQTISAGYPGRFRKLLEAFYKQTGRPILLNTSFNLKGEPIVQTPQDAYRTFMRSGLDILVLEGYVIIKKHALAHRKTRNVS